MASTTPAIDIEALKTHIDAKYFSIAICAWTFHEMIITTGDSITLFIFYDRWSLSKVLFLLNRIAIVFTVVVINILNFVSFSSNYHCVIATWAEYVGSVVVILIVAFTLASRVYALWKGNYIILTVFFLVMFANILNYWFIYGTALYKGFPILNQPPFTGCVFAASSNILWVTFANTLTFEALSIGLIIYKAWPIARQRGIATPLFSLLLEDGVGYYLAFTTSKLFTVGAIYAPTVVTPVILPSYFAVPVAALSINRLFIRLQRIMIDKPVVTNFNSADFSTGKPETRSGTNGEPATPRDVVTIGGTGRRREKYSEADPLSDMEIELGSARDRQLDVPMLPRHDRNESSGSELVETPMTDSFTFTIDSKLGHVV
ncbi:hypothetical protein M408DRAFT_173989 [Serendipita vermifera MAFF 305830]|uniref:DUF6533 domain-containing protein n=1 Tax=Serendipita vermifera MAFF 305830 TaxID=933852 RepID=A0A0C2WLG8_SERVB|nr:hypothetical protein M408DRAFT_173989 [Serendipita vermifera MAFF 305830]